MAKDSAALSWTGHSTRREQLMEKVSESDFVSLWDGTIMSSTCRTQASRGQIGLKN